MDRLITEPAVNVAAIRIPAGHPVRSMQPLEERFQAKERYRIHDRWVLYEVRTCSDI